MWYHAVRTLEKEIIQLCEKRDTVDSKEPMKRKEINYRIKHHKRAISILRDGNNTGT